MKTNLPNYIYRKYLSRVVIKCIDDKKNIVSKLIGIGQGKPLARE